MKPRGKTWPAHENVLHIAYAQSLNMHVQQASKDEGLNFSLAIYLLQDLGMQHCYKFRCCFCVLFQNTDACVCTRYASTAANLCKIL